LEENEVVQTINEEPKKMDYGKRLKNIRNYELHTQKNIAKILGISENTYTQYELQNQTIPLKHLVAFCDYYNIYLDYILGFSKIEKIENTKNVNNRLPISEIIKKIRKDLLSYYYLLKEKEWIN